MPVDKQFSDLVDATSGADADLMAIAQGGVSKQLTLAELKTYMAIPTVPYDHEHTAGGGSGALTTSEIDGYLEWTESTAPAAPAANKIRQYVVDDQAHHFVEYIDEDGTINRVQRDVAVFMAKNTSGGDLLAGTPVYVTGVTGSFPTIAKAKADSAATTPCAGLTQVLAHNNDFVRVQGLGRVSNINTSGFSLGDELWLSDTTAGGFVAAEPTTPGSLIQFIGFVTKSHASTGSILKIAGAVAHMIPTVVAATQVSKTDAVSAAADYLARIKLAGDTTYRAVLGLRASDIATLEFGPGGTAARDLRLQRVAGIDHATALLIDDAADGVADLIVGLNFGSIQAYGTRFYSVLLGLDAGKQVQFETAATTDGIFLVRGVADGTLGGIILGDSKDLRLYRNAAGVLSVDTNGSAIDTRLIVRSTSGKRAYSDWSVTGDTQERMLIEGDATLTGLRMGPGGAAVADVGFFRGGAKQATWDDNAGGNITMNVVGTLQQSGTAVSVAGHGAADHANVTRKLWLPAHDAGLHASTTLGTVGTVTPDLLNTLTLTDGVLRGGFWDFKVPSDYASGVITAQPVWMPAATDAVAHVVGWLMTSASIVNGTLVTTGGTAANFTGASAARTANTVVFDTATSTGVTPAAADDLFRISVIRDGGGTIVTDSYVGNVHLLGVMISYTANQ